MIPASQVVWRNRNRLEGHDRLLLVAAPGDDLGAQLARAGHEPRAVSLSFAAHRHLTAAGVASQFSLDPVEPASCSRIILFQPREKALLDLLLDWCACHLAADGGLWLVGENRAGIKSAGRHLDRYFRNHRKLDSARHCALFSATGALRQTAFSLTSFFQPWSFDLAGRRVAVSSLPGVFAHGRLDPGTRLLLEALCGPGAVARPGGRVLDFACGSGAIGLALVTIDPAIHLTLLDDAWLALESARQSFRASGLEARLVASDGLQALPSDATGRFDWIVSNPPFHSGVREDATLARRLLADAPAHLAAGGRLCLVANAHLPYQRWLSELFREVQVIAADPEYNVWLASGRRA